MLTLAGTILQKAAYAAVLVWACLTAVTATMADEPPTKPSAPPAAEKETDEQKRGLAGSWEGTLKVSIDLRMVFNIKPDPDNAGEYKATLDSPDQGAKGIDVTRLTAEGDQIMAEVKSVGGSFTGTLSADGKTIKGTWKQAGLDLPLELTRLDKEPDYSRPQDPKKPYPYQEEEVTFRNEAAGIKLAGTLTLPKGDKPAPAVVLVSGSGPQDRDEALLGHRPFLVLADHLTRQGIAVLRFDDRGVGGSEGNTLKSTTADVAGDALAAVEYLKQRKEINSRHIGIIGHSEGGLVAPLAATRSGDVAFIVLMAGTGVPGDEILYRQTELIVRAEGGKDETVKKSRATQEKLLAALREEGDEKQSNQRVREILSEQLELEETNETLRESTLAASAQLVQTPWFRYFIDYDPRPALRKVTCPALVINGEKDLQVDPEQNIEPIKQALAEAGNENVTVRVFEGLNHLFQHSETGSPSEYGKIEETISPEVLAFIADWINERVK